VQLSVLAPLWQKNYFSELTQSFRLNEGNEQKEDESGLVIIAPERALATRGIFNY
jgi:hypothetical protein